MKFNRRTLLATLISAPYVAKAQNAPIKIGFIALTDSAPLIIAKEKGLFDKHGVAVELLKQASWGALRDNLVLGGENNGLDAAHILTPMVALMSMGKITPNNQPLPISTLARLNTQGQGITLANSIKDLKDIKKVAMTFPGGTHDLWLRYWLAAKGIDPDKDVVTAAVPPPQMVATMKVGGMDAFCVGEPWNQQAETMEIGKTAIQTGEIWKNHPEKSFALRDDVLAKNPDAAVGMLKAVIEAQMWADNNRAEVADIISKRQYLNIASADIAKRLEKSEFSMSFWANNASYPYLSHDVWFLLENARWGKLPLETDFKAIAAKTNRADLWLKAANALGLKNLPSGETRGLETFFDGAVYDYDKPMEWLKAQKITRLKA
jgi:nitrate/nitrite transport system substrate-binding protein